VRTRCSALRQQAQYAAGREGRCRALTLLEGEQVVDGAHAKREQEHHVEKLQLIAHEHVQRERCLEHATKLPSRDFRRPSLIHANIGAARGIAGQNLHTKLSHGVPQ